MKTGHLCEFLERLVVLFQRKKFVAKSRIAWSFKVRVAVVEAMTEDERVKERGQFRAMYQIGTCFFPKRLSKFQTSVAQLYLDAALVCREPVVPHWDRSGINLSIYLSINATSTVEPKWNLHVRR